MAYLEIHTLDVKQGDCQFIAVKTSPTGIDQLIMIDGGPSAESYTVYNYWKTNFCPRKVDMLIISHWDSDHYQGIMYLTQVQKNEMYNPNCPVYSPNESRPPINYQFTPINVNLGDVLFQNTINSIKLTCYGTESNIQPLPFQSNLLRATPTNTSSLVFLLQFGEFNYYIGGDIDNANEDELTQSCNKQPDNCDGIPTNMSKLSCIKLSHHGSGTSTSKCFLCKTSPILAVCSNGNHNGFRHPSEATLNRLVAKNVWTLLTNPKLTGNKKNNYLYIASVGNFKGEYGHIKQTITNYPISNYNSNVEVALLDCQYNNLFNITNICQQNCTTPLPHDCSYIFQKGKKYTIQYNNHSIIVRRSASLSTSNEPNEKTTNISDLITNIGGKELSEYFPSFIEEIFGTIDTDCIQCICNSETKKEYELSLAKSINVSEAIAFEQSKIYFLSEKTKIGEQTLTSFHSRFSSTLSTKSNDFDILIDFSSNNIWEIEVVPKNLSLTNIAEIIPGFKDSIVNDWANTLQLQSISVERAAIGVDFSSQNDKVQHVNLGLGIKIFEQHKLLLNLMYRPKQGMSIYGSLSDKISVHDLLSGSGVDKNHLENFPDAEIDDFGFSATPNENNYSIKATVSDLSKTFSIGEIEIIISSLSFEIEKQETSTAIKVEIQGAFNNTGIIIKSNYDTFNGFVFTGTIDEIDANSLLSAVNVSLPDAIKLPKFNDIEIVSNPFSIKAKTDADFKMIIEQITFEFKINEFAYSKNENYKILGDINLFEIDSKFTVQKDEIQIHISEFDFSNVLQDVGVNKSIANIFGIKLNDVELSVQKDNFNFKSGFKELLITKSFLLHDNTIEFSIAKGTGLSVSIFTHLDIDFNESEKIRCTGGLKISPESLSFFAKSEGSIKNVFGINDFNFGELFVCLNETKTGLGVGFMGNLEFKKLSGQIALYFSTTNPSDKLLAVNLDSLTLLDIVDSIVECKNTGVDNILDSIGVKPIKLKENIVKPEISEDIKLIIKKTDNDTSENYNFKSKADDGYNWLPSNSFIIEDKSKFRTYILRKQSDNNYTLEKWITLYGCTSATGIELNGNLFDFGFAFSGELSLLGIRQIVNFNAKPKEGIQLYAELEDSIKLGSNVLTLCRVEDSSKGPILSLSTYPNDRHFYFSAKLQILSIIDVETRILFADNKFAFMLNQNILNFKSSIKAAGNFADFESTSFALSIIFETSGFSDVTQAVSTVLHEAADAIQKKAESASQKLEGARRTVDEYNRNIANTQKDIEEKNKHLSDLVKTHYPWYKAYKYAALAVKIGVTSAEIACLYTYKEAQIALLETAKGVLYIAQKVLEGVGELTSNVIDGIADVVAVIGKGIDWLININIVNANFVLGPDHKEFAFSLDFDLCGKNHTTGFDLSIEGDLKQALLDQIESLIHTTKKLQASYSASDDITKALDSVYGEINADDWNAIESIQNDLPKLQKEYASLGSNKNKLSTALLSDVNNDSQIIQDLFGINTKNSNYTCSIDHEMVQDLKNDISNYKIENKKQQEFFEKHKSDAEQAIQQLNDSLKNSYSKEQFFDFDKSFHVVFTEKTDTISKQLIDLQNLSLKFDQTQNIEHVVEFANELGDCSTKEEKVVDPNKRSLLAFESETEIIPEQAKLEIISSYEKVTSEESSLSPYMKAIFFKNLGVAYAENNDKIASMKNFNACLTINKDLFGADSEEVSNINEFIKTIWK